MKFDILVLYYDNPITLNNYLTRLFLFSDYLQYAAESNVILADTGTPRHRVAATLDVLRTWKHYKRVILARADTDAMRAAYPPDVHVRPTSLAMNVAAFDVSRADLVIHSNVSQIYVPQYFGKVLAHHATDPRMFLQPHQLRLFSENYHRDGFFLPIQQVLKMGQVAEIGGLPDFSLRREHLLAIGGWDEDYIVWGMADIDLCCRLTGKIDFGVPAEQWHQGWCGRPKEPYANYGLNFVRPLQGDFFSLICSEYDNHLKDGTQDRTNALQTTLPKFVNTWGIVRRNNPRLPYRYDIYDNY